MEVGLKQIDFFKKQIDYSRQVVIFGKEKADAALSFYMLGYNECLDKYNPENTEDDLQRLYGWLMSDNRRNAQTFFTEGALRNVAKEIEFRLSSVESNKVKQILASENKKLKEEDKKLESMVSDVSGFMKWINKYKTHNKKIEELYSIYQQHKQSGE